MLKYFSRADIHKNSSGTNEVSLSKIEAFSYRHWQYLAKFRGKVIFNNYSYSNSTSKHQGDTKSLLYDNDIKVDLFLEHSSMSFSGNDNTVEGTLKNEVFCIKNEMEHLTKLINSPRTRKSTNEKRKQSIEKYKQDIIAIENILYPTY